MHALTSIFFPKQITTGEVSTQEDVQASCLKLILIVEIAFSAMRCFSERKFKLFDALVGETSCQLRAARIQQLAMDPEFVEKCSEKMVALAKLSGELRKLYKEIQKPEIKIREGLFQEALLRQACKDLVIKLNKDDQFLILSHALFATRDQKRSSITSEANLALFLPTPLQNVSETTCELIANKAKRELAGASVLFIQGRAKDQSVSLGHLFKKSILTSCDLPCAPCFFSIEILLRDALQARSPIAIKVERVGKKQLFLPLVSLDGRSFSLLEHPEERSNDPVVMFEGVSTSEETDEEFSQRLLGEQDAIEEFPHSRVMSVFLMNAAAHPQYAGTMKGSKIPLLDRVEPFAETIAPSINPLRATLEETELAISQKCHFFEVQQAEKICRPAKVAELTLSHMRMEALKVRAAKEGCLEGDPRLFAIRHIRCSRIGNEIPEKETL